MGLGFQFRVSISGVGDLGHPHDRRTPRVADLAFRVREGFRRYQLLGQTWYKVFQDQLKGTAWPPDALSCSGIRGSGDGVSYQDTTSVGRIGRQLGG